MIKMLLQLNSGSLLFKAIARLTRLSQVVTVGKITGKKLKKQSLVVI
jgi:hypothetical protein